MAQAINRTAIGTVVRRFLAALEPWYNWGKVSVERMEGVHIGDDGYLCPTAEGDVRFFELQWLGLHVAFQIGRTPKRRG
jgi:hypothetical protein